MDMINYEEMAQLRVDIPIRMKMLSGRDVSYVLRSVRLRQPIHDNQPKNAPCSSLDIYTVCPSRYRTRH